MAVQPLRVLALMSKSLITTYYNSPKIAWLMAKRNTYLGFSSKFLVFDVTKSKGAFITLIYAKAKAKAKANFMSL